MTELIGGRWRIDRSWSRDSPWGGRVFQGVDEQTGRDVDIYELPPSPRTDLREQVQRWQAVNHPHLLTPVALLEEEGVLIQESLHGTSLGQLVRSTGAAFEGPLRVVRDVAAGLDALHGAGLVHGAVRAETVYLSTPGAVLMLDAAPPQPLPGVTAPEVARGAAPTVSGDVYGLGVLLAQGYLGRQVFEGASDWALIGAQERGERRPYPLPPGVSGLLDELLAPEPTGRLGTAADAAEVMALVEGDPGRIRKASRRWLAPVRPSAAWAVVGEDPAIGVQCTMASGLSRRQAHGLAKRLRQRDWKVRPVRVALGWRQIVLALLLTLACGIVLPGVGAGVGLVLGWWVGSTGARPELVERLPRASTPLPPRRLPAGTESVFAAGLLLLLGAGLLMLGSELVLVPLLGLVWVIWAGLRTLPHVEPAQVGRARAVLASVHAELEERQGSVDAELALLGEAQALAVELNTSRRDVDDLLRRSEGLLARCQRLPQAAEGPRTARLRRTQRAHTSPKGTGG